MIARIMLDDAELNITPYSYITKGVMSSWAGTACQVSWVRWVHAHCRVFCRLAVERGCVADQPQRLLCFQRVACAGNVLRLGFATAALR
jgi:hypothetical protein